MYQINEIRQLVEEKINSEILNLKRKPRNLYEPVEYILSIGGKRIRPALVLMSYNLFSENIEKALLPAIAYEVLHNFTLLHDDIMDNSNLRRNKPTVHTKWNNNTAILSGDAMAFWAYDFLKDCPDNSYRNIFNLFTNTALQICEGQQFDMDFENQNSVTENDYLEMIRLKTAVLLAACLKTGVLLTETNENEANKLYDFGINIGIAFQLQDDFLDTYGDTEVFGKKTGNDIIANKKTYLLIKALQLATNRNAEKLHFWINTLQFNAEEKVADVTKIYNELNIKEITKQKMHEYYLKAIHILDNISVEKEKKELLYNFAHQLVDRTF